MSELFTFGRVRLVTPSSPSSGTASGQPKRLALLAYLVVATPRGLRRRDALLARFWPELSDDDGRRALRQALHYLRRALGDDALETSGDEVGIADGAVRCDAVEFERLLDEGQAANAMALYEGDFLEGFHVSDVAPEFEEWVDRSRVRLRTRAAEGARLAADAAERAGEPATAVRWARRACELAPDDETAWRALITLLDRVGDRAGALRAYDELDARLTKEFDSRPSAETARLAEEIRARRVPLEHAPTGPPVPGLPSVAARPVAPPTIDSSGHPHPSPSIAAPNWRRRAVIGAALGVVLIATWATVQQRGAAGEATLVRQGILAARDRIVVADFADLARDSLLAAAVTEAFRTDLSQSAIVRVLSPRQVRSALTHMERSPDVTLDDSVAREVAVREGVKAFVTGSVGLVGGTYTISVQLVEAQRGDVLTGFREVAADSNAVIGVVDRISQRLRAKIGESLRELRASPPLVQATTASLAALRKFSEAQRLHRAGDRSRAIPLLNEAIALDTGFAYAHLTLVSIYTALAEPGRADVALDHAIANKDRLPFTDRYLLIAQHAHGKGDYETAIDAYNRVIERFPDDVRALNNLSLVYRDRRQPAVAESLLTRAIAVDSTIAVMYFGVHNAQVDQAKFDAARHTLQLIAQRFPRNEILGTVEVQDAAARQDWDAAEQLGVARIAAMQRDTLQLVDAYEALAGILMTRGRLSEATRAWRAHQTVSDVTDSRGRHLFGVLRLGYLELRYRHAPARARALVDSAIRRTPLDSILPGDRPYDELARFYASAGDLAQARQYLTAADANDRALHRSLVAERSWTRGAIALAEGRSRVARAESELWQAAQTVSCAICPLPDLARAYEAAGKSQAAVVVYERYLATPYLWRYEIDAHEMGWMMKRLAELYDARGEAEKATAMRARLLQLWNRADPELEPVLREMRARLAR